MQLRILVTIFALSLALSPTVLLAQQEPLPQGHEAHHPEGAISTDETAASDQAGTEASSDEPTEAKDSTDLLLATMQQRMEEMLSHWDKMSQTTDPAQRQQLMLEHRQKMMALNVTMHDMARQKGMMSKGQGGGMMGGQGTGMMGQGKGSGMMGGQGMGMMKQGQGSGMMGQGGGGMMSKGQGGGMMGHGGNSNCQVGLLEAYRQLEKRVDLLQKMVEEAMRE
ncbi:MAG: hypothetical protein WBQ37_01865 [Candidatus Competibacter sp.]